MTGAYQSLRVDTDALAEASSALAMIAADFSAGDAVIRELLVAVGQDRGTAALRHELAAFSSSWDARREQLRDKIEDLKAVTAMVAREFENVDCDLASQLSGGSSGGGGGGGGGGGV